MTTGAILLSGGTGFIGGHLIGALLASGTPVWVWSRDAARARRRLDPRVRVVSLLDEIPADAHLAGIVSLAGAPVVGPPWTESRRRVLVDSRVAPTHELLRFVSARRQKPDVLVSASAIGYYGSRGDEWLDEGSAPTAEFQSRLCQQREAAANEALASGLRAVNLRLGLVLGRDGGIFPKLALAAKFGAAAVLGDGRQWMSWIHVADAVRIIELALAETSVQGAVNAVTAAPVRQAEFQRQLTRALRRPLWLRVPAPVLRLAMGEMSDLLVRSQRVTPRLLQSRGFEFSYPDLEAALPDLVRPGRS
jgi:uncharacterized protein (TIGR01777 family)